MNHDAKMWSVFDKVAARWPEDGGVKLTLELRRLLVQQRRRLAEKEATRRLQV